MATPDPSSSKRWGARSFPLELTATPRFTGVSHPKSSRMSLRRETQVSKPPDPPGRLLEKYIERPSREKLGSKSREPVLMFGPRFTGGPQGSLRLVRRE